jgi:hypothetical protein
MDPWLEEQIRTDRYKENYVLRVDNSTYKPIIDELLRLLLLDP